MPKAVTKDKVMAAATKTVNVVECSKCGAMHLVDGDGFVAIYGNITVGMNGGIIGDNIDEKGKVIGSVILCRRRECLGDLFEMMLGEQP